MIPLAEQTHGTQGIAPLAGGPRNQAPYLIVVQPSIVVHHTLLENLSLQTTGTDFVHQRVAPRENVGAQTVTLAEVQALLQKEKTKTTLPSLPSPDIQTPYPMAILQMPYLEGYTPPKFVKFDGKKGNAQEHVVHFIETMGAFLVIQI